jgi:hypothetical protein
MRQLLLPLLIASLTITGCNNGNPGSGHDGGAGNGGGNGGTGVGGNGGSGGMPMPPPDMADNSGIMWPDPGTLPPPDHDPTAHPPLPRLNNLDSTDTMQSPKVHIVVWKGDESLGQQMQAFTDFFLKSSFWTQSMAEYGVKAGQGADLIVLDEAPPAKIDIILSGFGGNKGFPDYITEALTKGNITPDKNTLIAFIIDPNTSVTQLNQPGSCVAFGGFHQATQQNVAYAVAALCPNATTKQPDYDELTISLSHEIEEAASDPLPQSKQINAATGIPGGGEIGDACLNVNYKLNAPALGKDFMVQRVYSDANAAKNNVDPCLINDGPFFGTGIWSGGTDQSVVTVTRAGGTGSAKFKLEPFSYDNTVGEVEFTVVGSLLPAGVTLTPDIARRPDPNNPSGALGMRAFGKPGSSLEITVNVDSTYMPPVSLPGLTPPDPSLVVFSRLKDGHISVWWGTLHIE